MSLFILCKSFSLFLHLLSPWCPLQYGHFAVWFWRSFVEVQVLLLCPRYWHLEHLIFVLLLLLDGFSFWSGILLLTLEPSCMFSGHWWILCPVPLQFQQYSFMLQFEGPARMWEVGGGGGVWCVLRCLGSSSAHLLGSFLLILRVPFRVVFHSFSGGEGLLPMVLAMSGPLFTLSQSSTSSGSWGCTSPICHSSSCGSCSHSKYSSDSKLLCLLLILTWKLGGFSANLCNSSCWACALVVVAPV